MNFNHPVKEIVWVVQPDANVNTTSTKYAGGKQHFNFTDAIDQSYYTGTPGQPLGEGMVGPNDAPNNNLGLTSTQTSTIENSGLLVITFMVLLPLLVGKNTLLAPVLLLLELYLVLPLKDHSYLTVVITQLLTPKSNLTVTTDYPNVKDVISILFNLTNITLTSQPVVLTYIHSHLNQKNINLLEPVI